MNSGSTARQSRPSETAGCSSVRQTSRRRAVCSACRIAGVLSIALFIALPGSAGCSAVKPIPVREVADYPNCQNVSNVRVAADAFRAPRTRKTFNHGINEKGFLPVLIVVRNDSADSVTLNAGEIHLRDAMGRIHRRIPARVVAGNFERSPGAEAFFLFGLISFLDADRWNEKLHADWQDKEIANRVIVQPHSTAYGFAYFELPKSEQQSALSVTVPVIDCAKQFHELVLDVT